MTSAIPSIVVVEDAPSILLVLQRLLRDLQLDYDIIAVDNGRSALAHAVHRPCALLITDYMLEDLDGLALAREFKERWGSDVIMITAYGTPELRSAAHSAGVDHFITKPFFVDDLEAAVRARLAPPA